MMRPCFAPVIKGLAEQAQGFSLIESLIYISCNVLIVTLFASLMANLYKQAKAHIDRSHYYLDMVIGFNKLIDDVQQASCNQKYWKTINKSSIIFQQGNDDCGWCLENNNLFRSSGKFNKKRNIWRKRTKNLVSESIQKLEFKQIRDGKTIKALHIKIQGNSNASKLENTVAPRIGVQL